MALVIVGMRQWQTDESLCNIIGSCFIMDAMAPIYVFALWAWPRYTPNSSAPVCRIKQWIPKESRVPHVLSYGKNPVVIRKRVFGWRMRQCFFFHFVHHVSIALPYRYEGTTTDWFDCTFPKWFLLENCTEPVSSISVKGLGSGRGSKLSLWDFPLLRKIFPRWYLGNGVS